MYNREAFTYYQHDKDYTDSDQNNYTKSIVSNVIPKNTVLYTYLNIEFNAEWNAWADTPELKQKLVLQYILRNSFEITYNHEDNKWKICISNNVNSYKYYYKCPMAAFGVYHRGKKFNTCIPCVSIRDVNIAYFKSVVPNTSNKTNLHDKKINHRINNIKKKIIGENGTISYGDYLDPDRVITCLDKKTNLNLFCKKPGEYDVCITNQFKQENHIDGISSIAGLDSLCEFKNKTEDTEMIIKETEMFTVHKEIITKINDYLKSGDDNKITMAKNALKIYDQAFCNVEADRRYDESTMTNLIYMGWSEICNPEFGFKHLEIIEIIREKKKNGILNDDISIDDHILNDDISIDDQFKNKKITVTIPDDKLFEFIQNNLSEHIPFIPIALVTSDGYYGISTDNYYGIFNLPIETPDLDYTDNAIRIAHNLIVNFNREFNIVYDFVKNLQLIKPSNFKDIKYDISLQTLNKDVIQQNPSIYEYSMSIEDSKLTENNLFQKLVNMYSMTGKIQDLYSTLKENITPDAYLFFNKDGFTIPQSAFYTPYNGNNVDGSDLNIDKTNYFNLLRILFNKLEYGLTHHTNLYNYLNINDYTLNTLLSKTSIYAILKPLTGGGKQNKIRARTSKKNKKASKIKAKHSGKRNKKLKTITKYSSIGGFRKANKIGSTIASTIVNNQGSGAIVKPVPYNKPTSRESNKTNSKDFKFEISNIPKEYQININKAWNQYKNLYSTHFEYLKIKNEK
jgi:hypothetical protein